MAKTALAVTGAAGRMGRMILALAAQQSDRFEIVGATEAPGSPFLNQDIGEVLGIGALGVKIGVDLAGMKARPAALIDFSAPVATRNWIKICQENNIALVIGTTGLNADDQKLIDQAAGKIAIIQATNMGLGINVLLGIAAQVARQLGTDYDIEVVEAHHNQKKDAPSGTALSLVESIVAATGRSMATDVIYGRHGDDVKRKPGTIGVHAVRMGDVVGDHTIYFATGGERVEIRHVATSRETFARGSLSAARFLAASKPGRYQMTDVLGIAK